MKKRLEYNKYRELMLYYERIVNILSNYRIIIFIIMIISFILKYYYYKFILNIVFILSLIIFFILVIVHNKYFKLYDYYLKYVEVINEYIAREGREWLNFEDKGEDFARDGEWYLRDLDIVGENSLFQYISVCKSLGGREALFKRLSNYNCTDKKLEENQQFIKWLSNNVKFCIDFQILINKYEGKRVFFSKYKNSSKNTYRDYELFIGIISSVIALILLLMGLFNNTYRELFYIIFIFNIVIAYAYLYINKNTYKELDNIINNYSELVKVFNYIRKYNSNNIKLDKIKNNINDNYDAINMLYRLDNINSLRNNILTNFIFNGIGGLNFIVKYYYNKFIINDMERLMKLVRDIEEIEADISLASIGIVRDRVCIPSRVKDIELEFSNLEHPLVRKCVSNDFKGSSGVNIITGSNMGGKTTFLRTIGINLILMQAGGYVCADAFRASDFKIFTSMRVMDDVSRGISTFYGELLRIKEMIDYNDKGYMLVLIDEIFKGTNYNDRMYGAKEVVNKLNNDKVIAFITTHDFELCESNNIHNFHFKEEYIDDRIVFDYKIRDGKCSSTNARYLMEKLGIISKK